LKDYILCGLLDLKEEFAGKWASGGIPVPLFNTILGDKIKHGAGTIFVLEWRL